jgi:sigma-B regulation protein RsbU (phosphoserine phosphatase)
MMLATLIEAQRPQLTALAQTWLSFGATSFSLWVDGTPLASWPANFRAAKPSTVADVVINLNTIGELRLTGVNSSAVQQRLETDAQLISSMALLQSDLDAVLSEAVDQQDQLLAFYNLTQATHDCWEIDQILKLLAHETAWLAKSEGAFLLLQLPNQEPLISHFPKLLLDQRALQESLKNLSTHDGDYLQLTGEELHWLPGIRNFLLVEIPVRGASIAVLGVLNKVASEFMSPDVRLIRAIAEYAGTQIEKVLMFQENLAQARLQAELEMAQRIQRRLTQETPPHLPELDIWAASKPASLVGGDFYDFIPRLNQPFTFVVGDISGKGMPAALLMAITRTVIRTETNVVPLPTPSAIVSRSNQELFDDFTRVSMFATIFVGQYDTVDCSLVYANAGHSPVIFCPAGGEADLLRADGTALGVLQTSMSQDHSLRLKPGDVLVVATDGLNEARNVQDMRYGYNRLLELTQSLAHRPAREIADALNGSVRDFSNGVSQEDDQTLMVLKFLDT